MNNAKNSADVELAIMGGLCTEMAPSDLPLGASPLCYDVDYLVGSVKTRDGLASVYTQAGAVAVSFPLETGTPDQTGFSLRSAVSLTNWFSGCWEFVPGHNSAIYFTFKVPNGLAAVANAQICLDLFNGGTAGRTANFQTSDGVIASGGNLNLGVLSSAPMQNYAVPGSLYLPTTLAFAVQSSFVAGDILVVKIATSTTGAAPSTNVLMFPYLSLNLAA